MKTLISILTATFLSLNLLAGEYKDDFERSDTPAPKGGAGENWTFIKELPSLDSTLTKNGVFLQEGSMATQGPHGGYILYTKVELKAPYKVSAILEKPGRGYPRYAGIVVHGQKEGQGWIIRVRFSDEGKRSILQFLSIKDPVVGQNNEIDFIHDGSLNNGKQVLMEVQTGIHPKEIRVKLSNAESGKTFFETEIPLPVTFKPEGGYAGLFFSRSNLKADEFKVESSEN